jgi:hypothetical protein
MRNEYSQHDSLQEKSFIQKFECKPVFKVRFTENNKISLETENFPDLLAIPRRQNSPRHISPPFEATQVR